MSKERRFYDALRNLFVGAPVEGESGYINLMRLKTRYFEQVMMPRLKKEIEDALKPFPLFREELFDKLYTFFRRYFTESGSIGFFFTPYHQSVYERVYTDDQDVVLFWKTARLYYVKTDRLFRSMTVEVDGFRFFFDVSTLEHKKANEKRSLIFEFKERREDGVLVFTVRYSERGRQTTLSNIRSALRDALKLPRRTDAVPSEEALEHAFQLFERQILKEIEPKWMNLSSRPSDKEKNKAIILESKEFYPPRFQRWALSQETVSQLYKEGRAKIENGRIKILIDKSIIGTNWTDIPGYSQTQGFPTENSEILLKRVIESTSNEGDLVMDFFLGSGTTTAVAHKLKRKWIGVEMGEHFYSVVLPRMKKVLAYDPSGISKEKDVKEKYNQNKAGGFFKYYELEQYEDAMRRTRYRNDDLFTPPATEDPCQYLFLRDPKMLEALEVNLEQNTVKVDLSKLYEDIDLAETLSNLAGKWIKRIHPDPDDPTKPGKVEFADGTTADLKNPDWRLIKPLIWW